MTTNNQNIIKRIYYDSFDDVKIKFYSNASQKVINALSFNGDWYTVRRILLNNGYKVFDNINLIN